MKELACSFCSYCSTRRYNLDRHILSRHSDAIEQLSNFTQNSENGSKVAQNVNPVAQNVNPVAQNVNPFAQNVNPLAQNVNPLAQNVNPLAQNVNPTFEGGSQGFQCESCLKKFTRKSTLLRHKSTCTALADALTCPNCKQKFSKRQAKSRHMQRCKNPIPNTIIITHNTNTNVSSLPIVVPSTLNAIDTVQSMTQNNIQNQQLIQTQNNNHNHSHNNVTIHINNFGEERMDHITKEFLDERLREINGHGIYRLIQDIHFNPSLPENQNIRLASWKRRTLKVKENGDWKIKTNWDILELLIMQYKRMLSIRCFDPEFKKNLKHQSDFQQIQQDLLKFTKDSNASAYYICAHKILALIEDLDFQEQEKEKARQSLLHAANNSEIK